MILASPAYARAMAAIHAASFSAAEAWSEQAIAAQLGMPGVFALAEPEGFVLARVAGDEAEILTIAVHPDGRRRGCGLALLAAAEDRAGRLGAAAMFLEVARTNAAGRGLYARAGYDEVGVRRRYYAGKVDALVLRHTLAPISVSTAGHSIA